VPGCYTLTEQLRLAWHKSMYCMQYMEYMQYMQDMQYIVALVELGTNARQALGYPSPTALPGAAADSIQCSRLRHMLLTPCPDVRRLAEYTAAQAQRGAASELAAIDSLQYTLPAARPAGRWSSSHQAPYADCCSPRARQHRRCKCRGMLLVLRVLGRTTISRSNVH
jgi:hypothetical protein